MAILSQGGEARELEEQQKARNDVLLMYRKILMRLNMNEPLHQQFEKSLESLLMVRGKAVNQDEITATVTLACTILKREWEVTKYGPFTEFIIYLKNCVATKKSPRKIAFLVRAPLVQENVGSVSVIHESAWKA